jgi:hypothetical protein
VLGGWQKAKMSRLGFVVGVAVVSGLGALAGQLVSPSPARACECSPPSWKLSLASETSDDPSAVKALEWPERATLSVSESEVLWVADSSELAIVKRVEVSR